MTDPTVQRFYAKFELAIVHKYVRPVERQTPAADTLERILAKRGEPHLRLVLSTLVETTNDHAVLDEALLWVTSDLVHACAGFIEARPSDWLEIWDVLPVGYLQGITRDLLPVVPPRHALSALIYERIWRCDTSRAALPDPAPAPEAETDARAVA